MTWNVYQHWDPLRVCVVGRSYPPEFYHWIVNPRTRSLFERIAIETEEDYQNIISTLEGFGVEVLRPQLPENNCINGSFVPPPMTPRDYTVMIGQKFYSIFNYNIIEFKKFYRDVKDPSWPHCESLEDFSRLPQYIKDECIHLHNMHRSVGWHQVPTPVQSCYDTIFQRILKQGNEISYGLHPRINGAMVSRIGRDLYFGTKIDTESNERFVDLLADEFPNYRSHIINTNGHADGTYCPVCPGLIISLMDVPTYAETFPGWEVVYLPNQSWRLVKDFVTLKRKNRGKWWIPGWEHDQDVIDVVETWLKHWTGYVEETVFDVNMLIIDPKNVMVFNYNKQVFDAFDRYGITPHVVPFRHRYFWDGGIHCVTSDLHREGSMQDWFPDRS